MKRLCATKEEVIFGLPLVREGLALATGATLDCTADTMTLTIQVDATKIVRVIEEAQAAIAARDKGRSAAQP